MQTATVTLFILITTSHGLSSSRPTEAPKHQVNQPSSQPKTFPTVRLKMPNTQGQKHYTQWVCYAFALAGRWYSCHFNPGRCPGLWAFGPSARFNRTVRYFLCLYLLIFFVQSESVWKTVPSEARVTRDVVSGLQTWSRRLSGRQYQLSSKQQRTFSSIDVFSTVQFEKRRQDHNTWG